MAKLTRRRALELAALKLEREELLWRVLGELKRRRDALHEAHRAQAWADLERLLWAQHVRRQTWRRPEAVAWQRRRRRVARKRRRWARAAAREEVRRQEAERRARRKPRPPACGPCGVDEAGVSYCGCGGDYLLEPLEMASAQREAA